MIDVQIPIEGARCVKCGGILEHMDVNGVLLAYYCPNEFCEWGGLLTRGSVHGVREGASKK